MTGTSIEPLIAAVRAVVETRAPELLSTYDIYANEARFGRELIDADLRALPAGAPVLEVGAGMYLLACQLKREGIAVTALEPVGVGFSLFRRLQELVSDYARAEGIMPELLAIPAEELAVRDRFAFAYSLNVMEHVGDVAQSLERIAASLERGGYYRFVCPNYSFPYESHFHIPILWNKALTWRVLHRSILGAAQMEDPQGVWDSLNWIRVAQVKRICRARSGLRVRFDTAIFHSFVTRAMRDPLFAHRHGKWLCGALAIAEKLGILRAIRYLPAEIFPLMDCTLTKNENA